jgi:hypothetical protein
VAAVYAALSDNHYCKPAVLIAVLEMVDRFKRGDHGLYQYPTMPFSAMDTDTLERVQTDGMYAFHSVFESMALAERNMLLLNAALKEHAGCKIVLFCDCGCAAVDAQYDAYGSDWYQVINRLRSLAEAVGTQVIRIDDFTHIEWNNRNLDMGEAEVSSYNRMYSLLTSLPPVDIDIMSLAQQGFAEMFASQSSCGCQKCRDKARALTH